MNQLSIEPGIQIKEGKNRFMSRWTIAFQMTCKISPKVKYFLWKLFYQFLPEIDKDNELIFMNYGYAYLDGKNDNLFLEPADQKHLFCIQLYNHVTKSAVLSNSDVLDVGCGRGGGPYFITRYFSPRRVVGLDFSKKAIDFNTTYYRHPALSFVHGKADSLPFEDKSFDFILNIESSRCYPSMISFLREVLRVLRPGGLFLFADFRDRREIMRLEKEFAASKMKLLTLEDITANVLRALELDHDRKYTLLQKKVPPLMSGIMADFIGLKGSSIYRLFEAGDNKYIHCILQKE